MRERRKEPLAGSEIEPETVCLQAVRALCVRSNPKEGVSACLLKNDPASYITDARLIPTILLIRRWSVNRVYSNLMYRPCGLDREAISRDRYHQKMQAVFTYCCELR